MSVHAFLFLQLDCMNKHKLTWVTDMTVLPNANKILLSFADSTLALYELSSSGAELQCLIVGLPYCVLVMDYW